MPTIGGEPPGSRWRCSPYKPQLEEINPDGAQLRKKQNGRWRLYKEDPASSQSRRRASNSNTVWPGVHRRATGLSKFAQLIQTILPAASTQQGALPRG